MKKKTTLLLIALLIISIGTPFIVSELFRIGKSNPLIITLLSPDGTVSYIGTVISGLASVFVAVIALRISNKANEINEQVLKQNERICADTSEKAVQPHISLCYIPTHKYQTGLPTIASLSCIPDSEKDDRVHFSELNPYEYSVVIKKDGIHIFRGIHELVKQYKETLFDIKKTTTGIIDKYTFHFKNDVYAHIEISNIGCGPAITTKIEFQEKASPDTSKCIIPLDLRANVDIAHIHLYYEKDVPPEAEYDVVIKYQNLHGKEYQQIYSTSKKGIIVNAERVSLLE